MAKVQVEFTNTCPCCDEYGWIIQATAAKYADEVEVKLYRAGLGCGEVQDTTNSETG